MLLKFVKIFYLFNACSVQRTETGIAGAKKFMISYRHSSQDLMVFLRS